MGVKGNASHQHEPKHRLNVLTSNRIGECAFPDTLRFYGSNENDEKSIFKIGTTRIGGTGDIDVIADKIYPVLLFFGGLLASVKACFVGVFFTRRHRVTGKVVPFFTSLCLRAPVGKHNYRLHKTEAIERISISSSDCQ